ncbi:hypothetical protein RvY_00511 [Ramazzottius varieornatus]|uniref:Uncharacterized protein n=1 Tax=Ramazzottius varieornatus TaxID=947166 RepID=A0A1D1UD14_RAMVA|nr:hypothetical protein RvY_00511 [Ramazzottius varieornatus]
MTCSGVVIDRRLNWTTQVDAVTARSRKRLHAICSHFPFQLSAARQLLLEPTNHKHQRQLEQVQKDFLKSIRLSKLPKGQHDGDFSQYRQHLAEVKWDYLWTRRAKAVLVNGFRIWTNGFPDGRLLMNVSSPVQQPPTRVNTRSQTCTRVPEGKLLCGGRPAHNLVANISETKAEGLKVTLWSRRGRPRISYVQASQRLQTTATYDELFRAGAMPFRAVGDPNPCNIVTDNE